MALGDGIRRNIASIDPSERALLVSAMCELNHRFFGGSRTDFPPGGVSLWFKQDEIHQATHVHHGPEFLPWHRDIVNRYEAMLRSVNPQLSLHYWDWTQDPRNIPNANLGGGNVGPINLFSDTLMGYGGVAHAPLGKPWVDHGFYVPGTPTDRDVTGNPADPPATVQRHVDGTPATAQGDTDIVNADDYAAMRQLLEAVHDSMHGFVAMGGQHIAFRDPFVFLLHSNVDRLFAKWQTDPAHPGRLDPVLVYGTESNLDVLVGNHLQNVNHDVEPWSTGHSFDQFGVEHFTRPWYAPENLGEPHNYKHPSVVFPPCYDTNGSAVPIVQVMNVGTPAVINFNDVPTGETATRAAVFRIFGCGDVTVRVKPGAGPVVPFSVLFPASGSVTIHHGASLYAEARIWLAYTAGAANVAVPDGSVTFECPENGKEFTFVIKANAINRPRVAVMMALDQSGSMDDPAGTTGLKRVEVLRDAARELVEVMPKDNGVGLIRFDHDAYAVNDASFPGFPITRILTDSDIDGDRLNAIASVNAHATNINGNTSVGDGVDRARQTLAPIPASDYDHKAIVVFTDGLENEPLSIADVTGSIDNRTFAIGLGNEQQVNTAALKALTHSTGGYLLVSGLMTPATDDYFRVRKYFLQILAGVTNNSIVLDPSGYIAPGIKVRIPFWLTEADIQCTPILLLDEDVLDLQIEAPNGTLITPVMAPGLGITFSRGQRSKHYRYTLPVAIGAGQGAGLWYAVLGVNDIEFKRTAARLREKKDARLQPFATHGARYSLLINTYSNLRMTTALEQSGFEPGATLTFGAALTEYGMPLEKRGQVTVQLTKPGGAINHVALSEIDPGVFQGSSVAHASGLYVARIMAKGVTLRGVAFTREEMQSGAVWHGGNRPYEPPTLDSKEDVCRLLNCLLSDKTLTDRFEERLKNEGVTLDAIRNCVRLFCRDRPRRPKG
jgi:hypothetical protein